MNKIQRATREVIASKLIGDFIRQHADAAKSTAHGLMADAGAERVRVVDDAGIDLGTVSTAASRTSTKVLNEQAFTRWVKEHYPTEVELVVRPAFRKRLLDAAASAGDPVDLSTGEVIPGVEITAGRPYLVLRPTDAARDRMSAMLTASGVLALTSGDMGEAIDDAA